MESSNLIRTEPNLQRPGHQPGRRRVAPIALAALAVLLFTGCTAPAAQSASEKSASASAGFPIVEGKIVDEGKTADKKGTRVTVSSKAADPVKDAATRLKAAGFTIYSTAKDSLGAKSDKYFVSVSAKAGKLTYLFVPR
jgi:hypothetical protein